MPFTISVIIPSKDVWRDGNVPRLIEDILQQSIQPDEIIIVKGQSPAAAARNLGAGEASGDVLVFFDDDVRLGHGKVMENLIIPLKGDAGTGITGASQQIPAGANSFQKRYGKQVPRSTSRRVDRLTDSDMATTAAMGIRRETYWRVGGQDESLLRGEDPEFRYRVRKGGYRIVVAPDTWVYHPPPKSFRQALKANFSNGRGSARDRLYHSDSCIEVPEGHVGDFVLRTTATQRAERAFHRFLGSFIKGRWILLSMLAAHYAGWIGFALAERFSLSRKGS